jgi:hypothetical protein
MSNLFRDTLPQVSKVGDEVLVPEPSKLWAVGQVVDSLSGPFSRRIKGNPPAQEILRRISFALLFFHSGTAGVEDPSFTMVVFCSSVVGTANLFKVRVYRYDQSSVVCTQYLEHNLSRAQSRIIAESLLSIQTATYVAVTV